MGRKITVVAFIIIIGLFSSGCTRMIIMKSIYPSYDETISSWPKLRNDYGRVIFYYNNLAGAILFPGARTFIGIDDYHCSAEHGQFVYDDLPAGSHTFSTTPCNKKQEQGGLTVDIRPSEILYVEISYKAITSSGSDAQGHHSLRIVDKKTALDVLATSPQFTYAYKYIGSCLAQQLH